MAQKDEKKNSVELVHDETTSIQPADPSQMNPNQLVALAVQQGADLDKLEKLMDLQERHNKAEALKSFNFALAEFKSKDIQISRNQNVKYETNKGKTDYNFASLDHIANTIDEALSEVGITYRWNTSQNEKGDICVTCILTHSMGHSEETMLTAAPDSSGGKNSIQAIGSTTTYLQRYTLIAACGLTIGGMDNDGRGGAVQNEKISEQLVKNLQVAIKDAGADEKLFKDWLKTRFNVENYEDILDKDFDSVIAQLKKKQAVKKKTSSKKDTES